MATVFKREVTLHDKKGGHTKYKAKLDYVTEDSTGQPLFREVERYGKTKQEAICSAYDSILRREL